jgi:hypothetical protein
MRSLFAGMIMLSASMAVVDTAQAQIHPQRPPGYRSMQTAIGHRQPTQDDLQPTQDDIEKIDKDNQQLDLRASQDGIERDDARLDGEIRDICPSCGGAEDAPPVRQRRWPIHNGFNHQPTRNELRALHQQDVTRAQAQEIDRLYDQLMSGSNQIPRQHPARAP